MCLSKKAVKSFLINRMAAHSYETLLRLFTGVAYFNVLNISLRSYCVVEKLRRSKQASACACGYPHRSNSDFVDFKEVSLSFYLLPLTHPPCILSEHISWISRLFSSPSVKKFRLDFVGQPPLSLSTIARNKCTVLLTLPKDIFDSATYLRHT